MDGKIKVYNPTQHDVGVFLLDNPLNGRNIRPGSFIFMTEADIEMLLATTRLFADGHLKVEEKAEQILIDNGIEMQDNPSLMSEDEIKKKLSMSAKKIGDWLEGVEVDHVLDRIYQVAMSMDLPKTKLEVLRVKMPDRDFI